MARWGLEWYRARGTRRLDVPRSGTHLPSDALCVPPSDLGRRVLGSGTALLPSPAGPAGERGTNLGLPLFSSNLWAQAWAQSRCGYVLRGRQSVVLATSFRYSENGSLKNAIWPYLVTLKIFFNFI